MGELDNDEALWKKRKEMMQDAVLGATATKGQAGPRQSAVSFCGNIWW